MIAFFNGTVLGVSAFGGLPTLSGIYNKLRLHGGVSYFDNVWVINRELTDEEFMAIDKTVTPVWTPETLMLATFNNSDLSAGSIIGVINPITDIDYYRREADDTVLTKLGTTGADVREYIDYTAQPNKDYIYSAVAKNDSEMATPIEGEITTDFFGEYLIDPTTLKTYLFDLNLDISGMSSEVAHQRYDGYNKYSGHSFGERDFLTGNVTAIVSNTCTSLGINQSVDFVKELQTFINNGNEKILKTRKGEVLKVYTFGFKSVPLNIGISDQPYEISFDFEESGEVHG